MSTLSNPEENIPTTNEKFGDIVISENVSGNVPKAGLPIGKLLAQSCPIGRFARKCAALLILL